MHRFDNAVIRRWVFCIAGAVFFVNQSWGHGSVHERIAAANEMVSQEPNDPRPYLRRSMLHVENKDFAAALSDVAKAERIDPPLQEAELYRALVYWTKYQLRKSDGLSIGNSLLESKKSLERYFEKSESPNDPLAFATMARIHVAQGLLTESLGYFDKAMETDTTPEVDLAVEKLRVVSTLKGAPETRREARRMLDLIGPDEILIDYAIEMELRNHNYREAIEWLDTLPEKKANRPSRLIEKSRYLLQVGNQEEAEKLACRAFDQLNRLPSSSKHSVRIQALFGEIKRTKIACG